jgi:hypothetical protein
LFGERLGNFFVEFAMLQQTTTDGASWYIF